MKLTQQNAHLYEGKTVDAYRRKWHYYPLQVMKSKSGRYVYKDRNGTFMDIPEETDSFNAVDFDYWFDCLHESEDPPHA